ncbi:MAG: T9SS type A sorting domain-containing protein [Saprospiraceae bacterium]
MTVPSAINVAIWPTQEFINEYPNQNAARAAARDFVRVGVNALNAAFADRDQLIQINIIFFPNTSVAPSRGNQGLDNWTIRINTDFKQQWPCLPIDVIIIPREGSGHSHGRNHVAIIANGHLNDPRSVAHEIMHGVGLSHASNANCAQDWTFMCDPEGPIRFNDHLMNLLETEVYTTTHCTNWMDVTEERPDDFTCPPFTPTGVGIAADQPYLIRNCVPDRSLPMYSLTVTGGTGGATGVKVRARYNRKTYDINLATMGMDFNNEVTTDPFFNELRIFENGVEKTFDLAESETQTFHFQLSFNPDAGFTPNGNQTQVEGQVVFSDGSIGNNKTKQKPYVTISGVIQGTTFGDPLYINGNVTFTSAPTFTLGITNPSILVSSGGSITIPTNSVVQINRDPNLTASPVIEGCSTMWQGITVNSNARLEMEDATIKDANAAITVNQNGNLTATRSTFTNNNYGIRNNPAGGFGGAPHLTIRGNTFETGLSGLKPPYSNQYPLPSNLSFAGIYLESIPSGVVMDADPTTGISNYFSNLHLGILARYSTFTVRNSHFSNILQTTKPAGYPGPSQVGRAIYAEHCTMDVIGSGIAAGDPTVAFNNTTIGIWAENSTVIARECYMRNVGTGIRLANGLTHGYRLMDNDMEALGQGIFLTAQSGLPNASSISNNKITVNGPASHGVLMMYNKDMAAHTSSVFRNTINLTNGYAGIRLYATYRGQATDNDVNILASAPRMYGVEVNSGDLNLINCNDVLGTGRRGMSGEMASRTDFSCNTADGPDYGLHLDGVFTGATPAIFVGDNKMKNNPTAGLLLGSNALIGPQAHRGNRWSNSGGMTLARHLGGNLLAGQSKFTVDANENAEYLPLIIDPSAWFEDFNAPEISFICNPNCRIPVGLLEGDGRELDSLTAVGALTGFEYQDHSLWLAQKRLYARLAYEHNPYAGTATFDNFLSGQVNVSVGQYAAMQQGLHNLFALTETDWTALDTTETAIGEQLEELANVEALLTADGLDPQDSTDLEAVRAGTQALIEQYSSALETRRATIQSGRTAATAALLAQNAALPATESFETNEKTVNAVVLQTLALGLTTLTNEQRTNLEAVAAQCPMADGEAVLHARALLALYEGYDPAAYDDSTACNSLRPGTTLSVPGNLTYGKVLVYPNPAQQVLHVRLDQVDDSLLVFSLYNTMGQLAAQQIISNASKVTEIPVGNLPDGMYYFSAGAYHSGKVVIRH